MTSLSWRGVRDFASGITRVRVTGELTERNVAPLIEALRGYLVEQPLALLIEIKAVAVTDPVALAAFVTVPRLAPPGEHPRLLLCTGPPTSTGRMVRATLGHLVGIHDSVSEALAVVRHRPVPAHRRHEYLDPCPLSPRLARRLVAAACDSWQLPHLADDAMVIVSELVSNAVEHARTELDLTVSRHGDILRLSVRDRAPQPPRPSSRSSARPGLARRGRGLAIVATLASDWGYLIGEDSKAVWATVG